jgi:hypothetical protein
MTDHPDLSSTMSISYAPGPALSERDTVAVTLDILHVCSDIEEAEGTPYRASRTRKLWDMIGVVPLPELLNRALDLLAELAKRHPAAGAPRPTDVVQADVEGILEGAGYFLKTEAPQAEPFIELAAVN